MSLNELPSHGGYQSGMPIFAGDDKRKGPRSIKRSSKVEIDDSERDYVPM